MTLFQMTGQLEGIERALDRIATCLERLCPPLPEGSLKGMKKEGKILRYGGDKLWEKEQFESLVKPRGLSLSVEKSLVAEMLKEYRQAMDQESEDR